MENIHLIINPTAGNGAAKRIATIVLEKLSEEKVDYQAFYTEKAGHAEEIAKKSAGAGIKCIIALGGDGTVFEVSRGLFNSNTSLGIIPAGTGNDFIKSLGLPKSPLDALDFILQNKPRPVDIGLINGELFMNVCGIGFDVSVLDYSIKAKKYFKGMIPYLWGVIQTIIHYKASDITLFIDDAKVLSQKVLVCSVANGKFIGGGMPISPNSKVDDGLLDVVVIKDVTRPWMIRYLPGLLSGKILTFKDTVSFKANTVKIESNSKMRVNVDGEIFAFDKAQFEILPKALMVHW